MIITTAECRNLAIASCPGDVTSFNSGGLVNGDGTYDGAIGLNLSFTSPPNSLSDSYSVQATATHEIDEVLGIGGAGSMIPASGDNFTGPVGDLDLYRYSAPGVRSYTNVQTTSPYSYFSIDGGAAVISYFNQTPGADFGDWLSNPIPAGYSPQVQDAFGMTGVSPVLGPSEITAFNVIGYDVVDSSPEPATLTLVGLGLALGFGVARRVKQASRPAHLRVDRCVRDNECAIGQSRNRPAHGHEADAEGNHC